MRKIVYILLLALASSSCAVLDPGGYQNSKLQKVKLGMDKAEVLSILGNEYNSEGLMRNENNDLIETITYVSYNINGRYVFIFSNGILAEWFVERAIPIPPAPQINVNVEKKGHDRQ